MSVEYGVWFPSKAGLEDSPQMRVICFHHAGGTEQIFTSKGSEKKPNPQPLLDFCKSEGIELIACQLPGRGMRMRESRYTDALKCAREIFRVLTGNNKLNDGIPYVFVAHSVGCFITFELCQLIRDANMQQPNAVYLSSIISPDTPENQRPWRRSEGLSESEFKDECRGWAVNDEVFSPNAWDMFEPQLRDDFKLFDTYEFKHQDKKPFDFPGIIWRPELDQRVTKDLQTGWSKFFKNVEFRTLRDATHGFVYDNEKRIDWQKEICEELDGVLLELTY